MVSSRDILYSKGNNDRCNTPRAAVEVLKEFMVPYTGKTVWCPFDTVNSWFVRCLREWGFDVVFSHIDNGHDFFCYEPDHFDLIVSNPPFTNKRKIFERCISFGKPFALIMTNVWLNDKAPLDVFGEDLQLLFIKERINFINDDGVSIGRPSFSSSYYCYNFLPKQIIVRSL